MAWLNLNESLNNIKGQISNFANNVLADTETESSVNITDYEELKKICLRQEQEILHLKRNNTVNQVDKIQQNGQSSVVHDNWDTWDTNEPPDDNENIITDLKRQLRDIENEKYELVTQLEQLDSEHQQNILQLVNIKEKLQEENNELKENYVKDHKKMLSDNEKLLQELAEFKKNNQEVANESNQKLTSDTSKTEEELKTLIKRTESELQTANDTIKQLKTKTTTDKALLENYKIQVQTYCRDIEDLQKQNTEMSLAIFEKDNSIKIINEDLLLTRKTSDELKKSEIVNETIHNELQRSKEYLNNSNQKIQYLQQQNKQYEETIKNYREEMQCQDKLTTEEQEIDKLTKTNEELIEQVARLSRKIEETQQDLKNMEEMFENLNKNYEAALLEKENLNTKYTTAVQDTLSRLFSIECEENPDQDFDKYIEDIFKHILQILEDQLLGKSGIINEKNGEIEKLMENSEMLSQEILAKADALKYYEHEYTELLKNNELLISELEDYKSNGGLQTISESNEDNMVLLENQLEAANKKISELEIALSDKPTSQEDKSNNIEAEITNKTNDYDILLNSFDEINIELDTVKKDNEKLQDDIKKANTENEEIKKNLERVKSDFENTEYQLEEANASLDTLNEELNNSKAIIEDIRSQLNKYKEELLLEHERRKSLEVEIKHVTGEFEIVKRNENSIKLQLEHVTKELATTSESNRELKSCLEEMTKAHKDVENKLEDTDRLSSKLLEVETKLKSTGDYEHQLEEANASLNTINEELDNNKGIIEDIRTQLNECKEELLLEQEKRRSLTEEFDNVKRNESSVKLQLEQANKELAATSESNRELKSGLKDMTKDFENKLEETDRLSSKLHEVETKLKSSGEIQLIHEANKGVIEDLGTQLNEYKEELLLEQEKSKSLEVEIKHLTEEFENVKRNENTIKLQLEQSNKELATTSESNRELKSCLEDMTKAHKDFENKLNDRLSSKLLEVEDKLKVSGEMQLVHETDEVKILLEEKQALQSSISNLQTLYSQSQEKLVILENQLHELNTNRNELIAMVNAKHQESVTYHNEIQRLSQLLQLETERNRILEEQLKHNEVTDKLTDQNNFLKEKCDVLTTSLLEEQAKHKQALEESSKAEVNSNKNLERLQAHLMEVEEHYTEEVLQAEKKIAELQAKLTDVEQREKNSNTMYTSVSIRSNQQVEVLQSQLQMMTSQRDELRRNISDAEDLNSKQAAALANLQFVLQQFQRDKEKDVQKETERIRRQINVEKNVQDELRKEITSLKLQLEDAKQGLQAAARLSEQLANSKKQIAALKEEAVHHQEKLAKTEAKLNEITSNTEGKVDKSLIKNLIIGFVTSNHNNNLNKDQSQILKIIATVLDFNQQDQDKVKTTSSTSSWLSSLLYPQGGASKDMSHESLSQAFVKFLENESTPRVLPSLLSSDGPPNSARGQRMSESSGSRSNTPRQSPGIILSEIVLPTFADFGQSRNSSSILKDVLKDNNT